MSSIIPFEQCIARPSTESQVFLLKDHLMGVRNLAHSFFQKPNDVVKTLIELAAVSHDIGKAHVEWQKYIKGKKRKGPNHSSVGAVFFSYLAYHFLMIEEEWENYQWLWLSLTRDIADHHGTLKNANLNENNLEYADFEKMDMTGIERFIKNLFPFFKENNIAINVEILNNWQEEKLYDLVDEVVERNIEENIDNKMPYTEMMSILQELRTLTAILIASDRFDIKPVEDQRIFEDYNQLNMYIKEICDKGKNHSLASIREEAQTTILDQWQQQKEARFFTLQMPTGYGKTLTAIKLAVKMYQQQSLAKIIYVAPYLSILEQNAKAIEEALKITPLEHHSMAILNHKLLDEEDDEFSSLITQSWAHPVVCTSFVQFIKAIFPRRAQETLRRVYLSKSVILIDEPQIIDAQVWNLFLMGLQAIAEQYDCRVIFISATMPPFEYGLTEKPKNLYFKSNIENNRYVLRQVGQINEKTCADMLAYQPASSSAVILNTIQDAIKVYKELPFSDDSKRYLIHGLMIPIHKKAKLNEIYHALRELKDGHSCQNIKVVSTQIIEAGADLSFHYMYRARAVLPSMLQAAGRINRHGELELGIIETGPFIREETQIESRRFIYDSSLCRITDELLMEKDEWKEYQLEQLVKIYYKKMFQENSYEAVLQDIQSAYAGHWQALSKHEVFKSEDARLPIFIPWDWNYYHKYIPRSFLNLLHEFAVRHPTQLYDLFRNPNRKKWSYQKQKAFSTLFNQFVLKVPVKKALKMVSKDDFLLYKIPMLPDDHAYNMQDGLILGVDDIDDSII
ncbi:MAG: CRISPR-associated helicase Cas3' [Desulfotomaculum sp.]|nr:CRISPR-associated helicase Cas3' [Desulfotomaculum sp.]